MGLISRERQREVDDAKKKGAERVGEEEPFIMGTPGLDLITLKVVDGDKVLRYKLTVEDGRWLSKEYSRVLMRRHRARQAAETTLLRLKEAIPALPEKLWAAAMVPDFSPFPKNRFMASLTPPIEGYAEKLKEIAKKSALQAKKLRNQLVTTTELSNQFSEIRFIQLQAIRTLLMGDAITGSWATVGVLSEKGPAKMSSAGKPFCVWKLGCLTEVNISVFLFGDAFTTTRKNILAPYLHYSTLTSEKMPRRSGAYCMYHNFKVAKKYTSSRTELQAGNLRTAFRAQHDYLRSQGIYIHDPLKDRSKPTKPNQPAKVLSIDSLK